MRTWIGLLGAGVALVLLVNCAKPNTDAEPETFVSGNFFGRSYVQPVVSFSESGTSTEICWYEFTERWKFRTLKSEEVAPAFKRAVESGSNNARVLTEQAITLEGMAKALEKIETNDPTRESLVRFLSTIRSASSKIQDANAFLTESNTLQTLVQVVGIGTAFAPKLATLVPIFELIRVRFPAASRAAETVGEHAEKGLELIDAAMTPDEQEAYKIELLTSITKEVAHPLELHQVRASDMRAIKNVIASAEPSASACPNVF
jgi:hypothetical protein